LNFKRRKIILIIVEVQWRKIILIILKEIIKLNKCSGRLKACRYWIVFGSASWHTARKII